MKETNEKQGTVVPLVRTWEQAAKRARKAIVRHLGATQWRVFEQLKLFADPMDRLAIGVTAPNTAICGFCQRAVAEFAVVNPRRGIGDTVCSECVERIENISRWCGGGVVLERRPLPPLDPEADADYRVACMEREIEAQEGAPRVRDGGKPDLFEPFDVRPELAIDDEVAPEGMGPSEIDWDSFDFDDRGGG